MLDAVPLDGIRAAGVMHSKVNTIAPTVELLKARWTGPLMAYPDSGYFRMPHWQFVDIIPVDDFVANSRQWIAAGVQIVGGCCGLGVHHIEAPPCVRLPVAPIFLDSNIPRGRKRGPSAEVFRRTS
jgi:S-methylmethionine-dependent homocysteine/selenocysteine methylase